MEGSCEQAAEWRRPACCAGDKARVRPGEQQDVRLGKQRRTGVKSTGSKIVLHESKVTSVMPKQRLTDQVIATRMLKLRDEGGPAPHLPFVGDDTCSCS